LNLLRIQFTAEAEADLDQLRVQNVVNAIETRILLVAEYPASGRPSPRDDVREAIEPKYGFLIPYVVKGDTLHVLRVYRGVRRPLDYQLLPSPEGDT
jgi:toxin ParE1/3/4